MADVRKTVEIALKVVGIDTKNITALTTAFTGVQKAIDKTTSKIAGLQKTLNSLKAPPSLSKVIESLKQLDKIKAPNLKNIADGFAKLGKMQRPPDLSKFATELTKLSNINLAGIKGLVSSLNNLMKISFSGFNLKITTIETGLKRLAAVNLERLSTVLKNLNKINLNKATSELKKVETLLKQTGDAAQQSGLKLRTFSDKVKTVLQFRIISAALLGVNDAVRNGLTAIVEYDQALKDLQAITGATTLEVAQMGATILEVASTTKFSASEVAEGMRVIGQAGFSASEAVETMQAVSDLATGTLSSMATTVDLVTTAMRVFQIDASQSATVADVFANAVNRSKLTIDKLRTSMNFIGPIAKASGVSFTELAAAMGTLANSGLRASTIGTGLRRVFAALIDPSQKLKDAARGVGVSLAELDPRSSSLSDVISNLGLVLTDAQVAFDLFGKRGAAAALALSDTDSGFQQMLVTVGRSGTAALQASIQMEGLGVSFKNLKDKVGILAIAIGEAGIAGAMRFLINVGRDLIDIFTLLVSTTLGKFIVTAGIATAAGYALAAAIAAFSIAAKAAAFQTVVAGMASFTSHIGLALSSLTTFTAALGPLGLALLAIGAIFLLMQDDALTTSQDFSKLADEYGSLGKSFQDYEIKVVSLKAGSKELESANKDLRTELLKVASGFTEISSWAAKAAASINPLTGEIDEGSTALKEYNEELDRLQFEKLVLAGNKLNSAIAEQTGFMSRLVNKAKDDWNQWNYLFTSDFVGFGKRADEAKDFAKQVSDGSVNMKELGDYIQKLDYSKLNAQQRTLINSYDLLNEQSDKFVKFLLESNKVSLEDTIENITEIAKASGITGIALTGVIDKFAILKESTSGSFSNIIEKWAVSGTEAVEDFIEQYKELGGVFKDGEEAQIRAAKLDKDSLIVKLQVLKDRQKAEVKAGVDLELTWKRYYEAERKLLQDAGEVRKATSENVSAQNIKLILHERSVLEKEIAKYAVLYKNNAELRVKYQEEATRKYLLKEKQLVQGIIIDPKIQQKAYKASLDERETAFAKHLDNIALQEAKGILSDKQAQAQKFQATIDFYKESYAEAVRYQNSIDELESPEAYEKAKKEVLEKEEAYYKVRTKLLIEFNADVTEANKKIATANSDVADEEEKNVLKRAENAETAKSKLLAIAEDYKSKREAIATALAKKLQAIDTQIADNRAKANSDILSLESSTEEKIRNVRKKGMSDSAKDASDRQAANKYLREGQTLLAEAEKEKDKEKLARGTDLIKQSESLATGLKSEYESVQLLQKSLRSLKEARNIQAELAELDLLKKKNEEIALAAEKQIANKEAYDTKVQTATTAINAISVKEDERHNKEMQNLRDEIEKWKEKLNIAAQRVETVVKDDPDSVKLENARHENELDNIQTETDALIDKYETARNELKDYELSQEELDMDFDSFFEALKGTAADAKEEVKSIMEDDVTINMDTTEIEETIDLLDTVDNTILDILAKVLGKNNVDALKSSIDKLKNKTVTITTRYVTQGKKAVQKATGGRLPGFGGGDKIPVLGEAGEWWINKFAVKKYGDDFISSINNMTLPKFSNGGPVGGTPVNMGSAQNNSSETLIVRFQAGGLEAPVKITDSNSRIAIKNMASELTKMRLIYAR